VDEERKKRLSRGGEGDNPYFGIPPRMDFPSKGLCPGRDSAYKSFNKVNLKPRLARNCIKSAVLQNSV